MEKAYRIIWVQYMAALHVHVKGLRDYDEKSEDLAILWLIQELKKGTSGIDKKSDPRSLLIDSLYTLLRMKQGATEANDN